MTEGHPKWAIAEAIKLLRLLCDCDTRAEKIDYLCMGLRIAYHRGGMDTCVAPADSSNTVGTKTP